MGTSGEKESMDRAFNQAAGNLVWPMLSRTNYQEWSSHIQCNLEGMFLWDAVTSDPDKVERQRDDLALGAILRGIPQEMHSMLLNKKTVKEAWEAIKTMRLGADRVKEVNAQKLLAEFKSIAFKPGEAIDEFAMRITKFVTDLRGLGEESVTDSRMVKKFLHVVPPHYSQVAVAIEMFKDMKSLTIEELVGHLWAAEDRFEPSVEQVVEKTGKLLLIEEEWMTRNKSRMQSESSSTSGGKSGGHYVKKEKSGARGGGSARDSGGRQLKSMGTTWRKGKCNKCGIYGHFVKECKTKEKNERQDAAHHANGDVEVGALLVAQVCTVARTPIAEDQRVFLNQERVFPAEYRDRAWILDTGATNHMTGCWKALTSLDESVRGAVRFGDGSMVEIQGIGAVTIAGKNEDHRVLTEVYYIRSLKCNIVSLVCLLTKLEEATWLWHARYGHLNFRALHDLGAKMMVEGIPLIKRAEQVPSKFWGEAVKTVVYILNRSPTKSLNQKTPFEAWFGRKPSVRHLRTFGCVAYAKRNGPGVTKLADRSIPGVFLGYEPGTKGYRVFDPINEKLMLSRDVVFDEKMPWNWGEKASSSSGGAATPSTFSIQYPDTDTVHCPTTGSDSAPGTDSFVDGALTPPAATIPTIPLEDGEGSPHTPPHTPIAGNQESTPPAAQIQWASPPSDASADSDGGPRRYRTIPNFLDTIEEIHDMEYSGLCLVAAEEPRSVEEAMKEQCWRQAMQVEMQAIEENRTWEVSDLPAKQRAIGLMWVFNVKKNPEGKVVKHKARLVAKGYAQQQGVDFDEVFAPVSRIETVRVLLALAAQGGWQVHHMDVKSAFLNGDLVETVFVQQPPGFMIGKGD
ncbi:uncharacterized protein [Miscanthus floridulus]|uniref:uncharacterized protein n=1 Tax=Miscanthus floridulus TaxID=154761 RepID=UPI00345A2480